MYFWMMDASWNRRNNDFLIDPFFQRHFLCALVSVDKFAVFSPLTFVKYKFYIHKNGLIAEFYKLHATYFRACVLLLNLIYI